MQLAQHEAEIMRLRSRIVQSPNRVKQTLSDLTNSLAAMKSDIIEYERKGVDHNARITVLRKHEIVCSLPNVETVVPLTLHTWCPGYRRAHKIDRRMGS